MGLYSMYSRVSVVRLDDPRHPWPISQEYDSVLWFPLAWSPDQRNVLFVVPDQWGQRPDGEWFWNGSPHLKIAPIEPSEGMVREFESPFSDLPISLPLPVGKTISPIISDLPWDNNGLLCVNWGNLAYIPIQPDGQAIAHAPGLFITNFNPRKCFVGGGIWSSSGDKILFTAAENLNLNDINVYILYEVDDILDGFTEPPRSVNDPRLKKIASSPNAQLPGGFSYDESLVFFQEDVNDAWTATHFLPLAQCDFDLFYADARPDQPGKYTQIHLPGSQLYLRPSPEGNRLVYCNYNNSYDNPSFELRFVSFDIEALIDVDLGGVLIDNSGTNLIVPPGALPQDFKVKIGTPLTTTAEAELQPGEKPLVALRLLDAEGLEKPKFLEPMTLTIRYTDQEVAGLDEGMLDIYYYDESDPEHPGWVSLGGTVDPDHNEITVEIQHFSKFAIGPGTTD
ncbi:MAG: hypothetical protein Kow0099_22870 [Candidatus Abyssubacteria bacterium]